MPPQNKMSFAEKQTYLEAKALHAAQQASQTNLESITNQSSTVTNSVTCTCPNCGISYYNGKINLENKTQ